MLNKRLPDKAVVDDDKRELLQKCVSLIFNNNEIGNIANGVIESLEFKQSAEILEDLSNFDDCNIVSTMKQKLEKQLEIKWNIQDQSTFYNILLQILKENISDINVIFATNMQSNDESKDDSKSLDEDKRKGVLFLGGSFSPCHTEHVELLNEIKQHLENHENFIIIAAYLVVTSDGYVLGKLQDSAIKYKHRHKICQLTASKYSWCKPSHIPMVSAMEYSRMITMKNSFNKHFGSNKLITESERTQLVKINCCGADKISASIITAYSDMGYDGTRLTCCIARKGYNEDIKDEYDKAKANDQCHGFVYINIECKPISSTLIRTYLLKLRSNLCDKIKDNDHDTKNNDKVWKMKRKLNTKKKKKYAEEFRKGVKDMLHPDAVKYLIDNIDDLWIKPQTRIVGGGKKIPYNVPTNSAKKNKNDKTGKKSKRWWSFKS